MKNKFNGVKIKNKKKNSILRSPFVFGIFAILVIYVILLLIPMLWAFFSSIKSYGEFRNNPLLWPSGSIFSWEWSNLVMAFDYFFLVIPTSDGGQEVIYLETMLFNSIIFAGLSAIIDAFVHMFMAYLAVIYKNPISKIITNIVIITMILPIYSSSGATMVILRNLGLYNNLFPYVIVTSCGFTGINYLIWLATFKSQAIDYSEAARIDGANEITIMFRIQFPLVIKLYMTFVLLGFIGGWSNYTTALYYLPKYPTIAYGLFIYCGTSTNATSTVPMRLAGCVIMLMPLLILFLLFHKQLVGNISFGGLKG